MFQFITVQVLTLIGVLWIAGVKGFTFIALIAVFFAVSYWMARKLIYPLARLMVKARQMDQAADELMLSPSSHLEEDLDEWGDLENAVNQMKRSLKEQAHTLSQERQELATIMASLSEAILAVNAERVPLFFNSQFILNFGGKDFKNRNLVLGELFRAPEVLKTFDFVLEEGQSRAREVEIHALKGSQAKTFLLSVAPLKREDGSIYGAVGIFHDVTELKQAERMRIDFVANVSHELRTPLTSIKGYSDTIRVDLENKKYDQLPQYFGVLEKNVDRLLALISDLLDLSTLESQGGAIFRREWVSTQEITERVLLRLKKKGDEKKHQIEVSYESKKVLADPHRLEQVLSNLLENAIKYTLAPGKIMIKWEEGAKSVKLHVQDWGRGIALKHQARLFERFYRVDEARSQEEIEGTGLGLAIVKHILQRHGGNAWVVSEEGKGADFICQFPKDL